MAAPNQRYSYRKDIPMDVAEKIRLQKLQRRQIELLETRLEQLRRSYTMLEAELVPYRVAVPSIQAQSGSLILASTKWSLAPINRCPDEILVIIFDLCVWMEPFHQDIARLFRVCRRWNQLIMDTSTLWNYIELPGYTKWFDIVHYEALHSYISAYMERSRGRPIAVKLHLDEFPDMEDYMHDVTMEVIRAFIEPENHDIIDTALREPNWYSYQPNTYNEKVKKMFKALFGENGIHIQRWSSLEIHLTWNEAAVEVFMDNLAKHSPKPTKLAIYHSNLDPTQENQIPVWFRNLSLVEELTLSICRPISYLGISPAILQHLCIPLNSTCSNLKELSMFSALQSLTIQSVVGDKDEQHSFTICLPRLHTLQIHGRYEGLSSLTWDIPVLKYLLISGWRPEHRIPRVSACHVHIGTELFLMHHMNKVQMGIGLTLSLSPRIQILTVSPELRTAALQAILHRQEKGEISFLYKLEVQRQGRSQREDIYFHDRPFILALIEAANSRNL